MTFTLSTHFFLNIPKTQLVFTCSKSILEVLNQQVKYAEKSIIKTPEQGQ